MKAIQPDFLLDSGGINVPAVTKESHGGKAASLRYLHQLTKQLDLTVKAYVPPAWAVPCNAYSDRPLIVTSELPRTAHYAVRSGAPVSMPGMMETKLGVPVTEIQQAANAVWDSYNSEKAVAYREQNNIPHDVGTGVIIQLLVSDARFSGVLFTAAPVGVGSFDPQVEYIEGFGDDLVSGKKTPVKATPEWKYWEAIHTVAKKIHEESGPSDVEFTIDKFGRLFLLQQRPLKVVVPPDYEDKGLGPIIATGESIGSPSLVKVSVKDLFVTDGFDTNNYSSMLKARAMLCTQGGMTCHAAIVSRGAGIPCIRVSEAILKKVKFYTGDNVIIDGATGAIHQTLDHKDVVEVKVMVEKPHIDPQAPDFSVPKEVTSEISPTRLLYKTYAWFDAAAKGEVTLDERNEALKEVAKVWSTYLFAALMGEARHYGSVRKDSRQEYNNLYDELLSIYEIVDQRKSVLGGVDRTFLTSHLPTPTLEQALKVTEILVKIFRLDWGSNPSVGGKRWAEAAERLRQYLSGEMSTHLFVDSCWNLVHNNGSILGKTWWFQRLPNHEAILNAKREGFQKLTDHIQSRKNSYVEYGRLWESIKGGGFDFKQEPIWHKISETAAAERKAHIVANWKAVLANFPAELVDKYYELLGLKKEDK